MDWVALSLAMAAVHARDVAKAGGGADFVMLSGMLAVMMMVSIVEVDEILCVTWHELRNCHGKTCGRCCQLPSLKVRRCGSRRCFTNIARYSGGVRSACTYAGRTLKELSNVPPLFWQEQKIIFGSHSKDKA